MHFCPCSWLIKAHVIGHSEDILKILSQHFARVYTACCSLWVVQPAVRPRNLSGRCIQWWQITTIHTTRWGSWVVRFDVLAGCLHLGSPTNALAAHLSMDSAADKGGGWILFRRVSRDDTMSRAVWPDVVTLDMATITYAIPRIQPHGFLWIIQNGLEHAAVDRFHVHWRVFCGLGYVVGCTWVVRVWIYRWNLSWNDNAMHWRKANWSQ